MKFIEKLQFLMKKERLTQAQVAREIGLTDGSITGWMNGSKPRKSAYIKLSNLFGVSLKSIMDDSSDLVFISETKELLENNKQVNMILNSEDINDLFRNFDEIYNIRTSEDKKAFISSLINLDDKTLKDIAIALAVSKKPLDAFLILHLVDFKKGKNA